MKCHLKKEHTVTITSTLVSKFEMLSTDYNNIIIGPDSVGVYTLFVSFVCLFVCLSVCLSVSPFPQPCFNTEIVTLVSYPGMANHRSLLNLDLIRPW